MSTSNKKNMTAAELQAELAADPTFQAEKRLRDEKFRMQREVLLRDAAPLIQELAQIGVPISSVWDLVNTSVPYSPAIPVLIKHLSKDYLPRNLEAIARALSVPYARGIASGPLLQAIRKSSKSEEEQFRWACANALTVVATKDDVPLIRELLNDCRLAHAHGMLGLALKKASRRPSSSR